MKPIQIPTAKIEEAYYRRSTVEIENSLRVPVGSMWDALIQLDASTGFMVHTTNRYVHMYSFLYRHFLCCEGLYSYDPLSGKPATSLN